METVGRNFVAKKLGVSHRDKALASIISATGVMSSIRMKNSAAFYHLVQQELSSLI